LNRIRSGRIVGKSFLVLEVSRSYFLGSERGKKCDAGTPIRECIQRDQLIDEWHEAVDRFSDYLRKLRKGIANKFAEQYKATEIARA
jgi:hypothetical protein